jgi:hypothetical protein
MNAKKKRKNMKINVKKERENRDWQIKDAFLMCRLYLTNKITGLIKTTIVGHKRDRICKSTCAGC